MSHIIDAIFYWTFVVPTVVVTVVWFLLFVVLPIPGVIIRTIIAAFRS